MKMRVDTACWKKLKSWISNFCKLQTLASPSSDGRGWSHKSKRPPEGEVIEKSWQQFAHLLQRSYFSQETVWRPFAVFDQNGPGLLPVVLCSAMKTNASHYVVWPRRQENLPVCPPRYLFKCWTSNWEAVNA